MNGVAVSFSPNVFMALVAVTDRMALDEREESMVETGTGPGKGRHGMTVNAICRYVSQHMVRVCDRGIIFHVTAKTFDIQGFKAQQ